MDKISTWLEQFQTWVSGVLPESMGALATEAEPLQFLAPTGVGLSVTVLCLVFLLHYFFPSFIRAYRLKGVARKIRGIGQQPAAERRKALDELFTGSKFAHAWQEYAETLHDQYEVQDGERVLVRTRATMGAGAFFSPQTMVETPLATEFYKHLPGILTGIGIIGTFFGLMLGLYHFDPSTPEQVSASVAQLLKDVLFAFLGSFFSILASIAVTLMEKWRLRRCYKHLESLTEALDGLFDAGVGEEYLAELVKSSNESSVQTRQLKDSLVTDLREMLQNLVESQVRENERLAGKLTASYRDSGQQLADKVSGAIENSLKSPLEALVGAVQSASGDQSNQMQHLLQDVLLAFMNKLETSFGQQFNGLHEVLGQSVTAMQSMQQGFASLIADMRNASEASTQNSTQMIQQLLVDMQAGQQAMQTSMNEMLAGLQAAVSRIGSEGEDAGSRMAAQLEKLFAESAQRQQAMAESLQKMVDTIQRNVDQGQQETMTKMATAVDRLGEQLSGMLETLEQGQNSLDKASRDALKHMHVGTKTLMNGLDEQVKTLLESVGSQHVATQQTLRELNEQTARSLSEMQLGADRMRVAAERFESAGNSVSAAGESVAGVLGGMQTLGGNIKEASQQLSAVVADYRQNRDALGDTLTRLDGLRDQAQAENALRDRFIGDLRQHAEQMQTLNREAVDYLQNLGVVMARGFDDFGEGVDRSLRKTLGTLDIELDKAIKALAGGVETLQESLEDLGDILDRIPARR